MKNIMYHGIKYNILYYTIVAYLKKICNFSKILTKIKKFDYLMTK